MGNEPLAELRWFWVPDETRCQARDGSPAPNRPEEVTAGARPFGLWPRWWTVRRGDGSSVEVLEEDILELPARTQVSLASAVREHQRRIEALRVVNVIAANVKARRLQQLRRLEEMLSGDPG